MGCSNLSKRFQFFQFFSIFNFKWILNELLLVLTLFLSYFIQIPLMIFFMGEAVLGFSCVLISVILLIF